MSSGDLPKDFPLKEANLLGPMIHLLLDKVEEMARMSELPPQYPNDQDKYDADAWTLAPNKPDHFKSGVEFMRQRDSIITKSSDATSFSRSMEEEAKKEHSTVLQKLPTTRITEDGKAESSTKESSNILESKINEKRGASDAFAKEESTQTDKSAHTFSLKKSSRGNKKRRMEIQRQGLKSNQQTLTATSDKIAKGKMKIYRTVPSRFGKLGKSSSTRLQMSRSAPSTTKRRKRSSMKNLKKRSTKIAKQQDDVQQRRKTSSSFRLKDYFDGIDPNNALYRSVFKLRRIEVSFVSHFLKNSSISALKTFTKYRSFFRYISLLKKIKYSVIKLNFFLAN
uniref:Uncharacterized protein n=1 Tax=Parascaris univalens TaxID=6257 RepID=A0A915BNZ3_PARUN